MKRKARRRSAPLELATSVYFEVSSVVTNRFIQWLQSAILPDYSWGKSKWLAFPADQQCSQLGMQSPQALSDRGSCTQHGTLKCAHMQLCLNACVHQHMCACLYIHVAYTCASCGVFILRQVPAAVKRREVAQVVDFALVRSSELLQLEERIGWKSMDICDIQDVSGDNTELVAHTQ